MEQSKEYSTAIHEAGHAVMAAMWEMTINYVTIVPKGESFGECSKIPIYYKEDDTEKVKYDKTLVEGTVRLAGFVAERDVLGIDIEQCTIGAIQDIKSIQTIVYNAYANDNEKINKLKVEIPQMTIEIIQQPRIQQQIIAIADALMKHKTLSGDKVKEIISSCEGAK